MLHTNENKQNQLQEEHNRSSSTNVLQQKFRWRYKWATSVLL